MQVKLSCLAYLTCEEGISKKDIWTVTLWIYLARKRIIGLGKVPPQICADACRVSTARKSYTLLHGSSDQRFHPDFKDGVELVPSYVSNIKIDTF